MEKISVNIIGCGKVGKTIGYLLAKKANCSIKGILNRNIDSSERAIKFIEDGYVCNGYEELMTSNLWLISTQDSLIPSVCQKLLSHEKLARGDVVIHFSGTLNSKVLYSAKKAGCFVGSLHPIKSFADPEVSIKTFKGTYCAYEGDKQAFSLIRCLFERIGAKVFKINREAKSLYHIGSVFASNYLIALLKISYDFYYKAGIKENNILDIIYSLSSGTLANIHRNRSLEKSITGPIQRGDIDIIKSHISSLESMPLLLSLYKALGNVVLESISGKDCYFDYIRELLE
ncbi:Rossmann-like and DUF2520 domain-containing protein [Wolbachia endosymbiont of Ctenocephalides felis wCfeT]|uniref:Rossmann-like and DUF2520 domain-containing protein n=1 Tax=Wolbachia endosymbiont of Ctenocephalides felis wCfeT TaxID=2732593 RepID=UPI00144734CE|nr:Rossmann-like and DUF2520 domain-containing protein [Wolbachia endosymbiont of Ctenocephalides felis wCfeT]